MGVNVFCDVDLLYASARVIMVGNNAMLEESRVGSELVMNKKNIIAALPNHDAVQARQELRRSNAAGTHKKTRNRSGRERDAILYSLDAEGDDTPW